MNRCPFPSNPVIKLEDVTLLRTQRRVFAHTNWTIYRGEHWVIVGETSAGKTTLAKALSGGIPVVSGRLLYFFGSAGSDTGRAYFKRGEVIAVSPDSYRAFISRNMAYLQARWQSFEGSECPTAGDLLTGESIENRSPFQVDIPRVEESIYRVRRERFTRLLSIDHLLDRKILHLSNGEGRKVLLARALMQAPRLLVLDDPFSALDEGSRNAFRQHLDAIMADRDGPTVVLVTSRLEEIPSGITHFAVVEHSDLVQKVPREQYQIKAESNTSTKAPSLKRITAPFPSPLHQKGTMTTDDSLPLISISNATVRYGETVVLRDVSWTVNQGENWAVLGPNGAGKTTLLSLIIGDNPQCYSNEVVVLGRKRGTGESVWNIKANISFLSPELQALYPSDISCMHVVLSGFYDSINLHKKCTTIQLEHATRWLRFLEIAHLAQLPFGDLSLGHQRLVLLARALVKSTPLIILDEPCQSLPSDSREIILDVLDLLGRHDRVSLIYTSHHIDELPRSISHILHMAHGKIERVERRNSVR